MPYSAVFEAIGVRNQVTVADAGALDNARLLAERAVAELDAAASRFRADSELVALNRAREATVSPLLYALVDVAVRAARWTGGLVDPTVGRSLRAAGYDADFEVVVRRGAAGRFDAVPAGGRRSIRLEPANRRISLRPGTELDLGATAKAVAADLIAAAIADETGSGTLVSLGGDVAVAGPPPDGGWPVGLGDDSRSGPADATVAISTGGLATSSTTVRRWGAGRHHLLDPSTGAPAPEVWRTVSVAARSCLVANAAATAAVLLGTAAPAWLDSRHLPARLVAQDGGVECVAGWPFTANSRGAAAR